MVRTATERGGRGGALGCPEPPPTPVKSDGTLEKTHTQSLPRRRLQSIQGSAPFSPAATGLILVAESPISRVLSPRSRSSVPRRCPSGQMQRPLFTEYVNLFRNEDLVVWKRQPDSPSLAIPPCRTNTSAVAFNLAGLPRNEEGLDLDAGGRCDDRTEPAGLATERLAWQPPHPRTLPTGSLLEKGECPTELGLPP